MFSSIKTAYYLLWSLALVFGAAVLMTRFDAMAQIFSFMNHSDITAWAGRLLANPLFGVWFGVLVGVAAGIFMSTTVCALFKNAPRRKRKPGRQKRSGQNGIRNTNVSVGGHLKPGFGIFTIHLVTLLVFACHAGDLLVVKRSAPVDLRVSQQLDLDGFSVRLGQIHYESSPHWLEGLSSKTFSRLPKEKFDPQANWALLQVYSGPDLVREKQVRFMSPLAWQGNFFLVDSFYYDQENDEVGIRLLVIHNPLVVFFFGVYLFFWAMMGLRYAKTRQPLIWKSRSL